MRAIQTRAPLCSPMLVDVGCGPGPWHEVREAGARARAVGPRCVCDRRGGGGLLRSRSGLRQPERPQGLWAGGSEERGAALLRRPIPTAR